MTTTEYQPDGLDTPDAIMSVRPRLRHDVLFADTGDGVALRGPGEGYELKGRTAYRLTASLAPFLTGELTVGELCGNLAPERRRMICDFVRSLIERGFARDVQNTEQPVIDEAVRRLFAAQINYVEHYVDDAIARFLRFRNTRVLVLGTGRTARSAALSLLRNGLENVRMMPVGDGVEIPLELSTEVTQLTAEGCRACAGLAPGALTADELARYDAVIAPADDIGVAALRRLRSLVSTDGPVVLPSVVVGGKVFVGPLVRPAVGPCWICAMLRLAANESPDPVAQLWRDISVPTDARPPRLADPPASMIGNLLGYELFRLTTGCLEPETQDGIVIQDIATLEVRRERLLAHPLCPSCGDNTPLGGEPLFAGALPADNEAEDEDIGFRPVDKVELGAMLTDLEQLVGAHVGVVSGFDDLSLDQSPVKVSRVRLGAAAGPGAPARLITAFDLHYLPMARRNAMRTAMLAYVGQLARARLVADTPDGRVAPAEFVTWTGLPVDGKAVDRWVRATSMMTGARHLVPASAVYPLSSLNDEGLFELSSAGDGAGSTLPRATRAGVLSALAYEALCNAVRGADTRSVALAPVETGSELEFLLNVLDTLELAVELIDLAPGRAYRVVLARAATEPGETVWTVGSGLSGRRAVIDALRDLIGVVQLRRELGPNAELDVGTPLLAGLDVRAVRPDGPTEPGFDGAAVASAAQLSGTLADRGVDALAVNTTTPDLAAHGGVVTARVLLRTPI